MSPQFPSSKPRTPPPGAIQFRQTLPFPEDKNPPPRGRSRWTIALLCSLVWLALIWMLASIHTGGARAGKQRQTEDPALGERYAMICGAGIVAIAAFIFSGKRTRR